MIEIHFSIPGQKRNYIIHKPDGGYIEILYEDNRQRVENEKAVCRNYGMKVSTDANDANSHAAIKRLAEKLVKDMLRS
jgi:hypothetical protein